MSVVVVVVVFFCERNVMLCFKPGKTIFPKVRFSNTLELHFGLDNSLLLFSLLLFSVF